jgi:hypothetical protein
MINSVHSRVHGIEDTWHPGEQISHFSVQTNQHYKTKLRGFSPQANYNDGATATFL